MKTGTLPMGVETGKRIGAMLQAPVSRHLACE